MGDFVGPVAELVLPGSRVHVQLSERAGGWRWIPDAAFQRIVASGRELTSWAPLTGDPASFARISMRRRSARWCALAGELPSPSSEVVVTTENDSRIQVDTLGGRVWACEWSRPPAGPTAPPVSASVSVDGGAEVAVMFFEPRRIHLASTPPEGQLNGPGQVLTGWYRYVEPGQ